MGGRRGLREKHFVANSDCRVALPANLLRLPLQLAAAQTHHCVGLRCILCFVVFGFPLKSMELGARVEDADGLEGRGATSAKC
jgi:hypothetical protein